MQITLIRHGQSEANKEKIIQGHKDYPLTDLGREQAKEIASKLIKNNYKFDAIYSSDLLRAKETAEIIAREINQNKITFDARLREFNLGIFQGRHTESLTEEEQAYISSCWDDHDKRIPQGETVTEMIERIKDIFEDITNTFIDGSSILIIGHGGTLYHILHFILEIYPQTEEWFSNCSFNVIEGSPKTLERWKLIIFNGNEMKE